MARVEISYEARFTAEHHPPGSERHANAFRLVVTVAGPLVGGMMIRFEDLAAVVQMLLRSIECVPPVEAMPEGSSTEQIAVWIWEQLAPGLSGLAAVTLHDGAFAATYRGEP